MDFSVKAPREDPAVTAARKQQQALADSALTSSIQSDLMDRMRARLRQFGLAPVGGAVPRPARPSAGFALGGNSFLGSLARFVTPAS